MITLLIAALGTLVAGVLAILYGISYKEFSFGNTILLAGVIGACTGLLLFGLWIAAREMRAVARRIAAPASAGMREPSLPELSVAPAKPQFPARPPAREPAISVAPPGEPQPPSFAQAEIEDRPVEPRPLPPAPASIPVAEPAPEPPAKPRRNLLFESSVRKDREKDRERASPTNGGSAPDVESPQRTMFDDPIAQRAAERTERLQRARSPSTYPDPKPDAAPGVTVLKSGVVDGMAYSLYSDGSIEAQMPEGMMRFGSIEELRTHLDQRT